MNIDLNGKPYETEPGTTISDLIVAVTGSARGSAAVLEGEIVPRSVWDATAVESGQSVEIVTAVQGG